MKLKVISKTHDLTDTCNLTHAFTICQEMLTIDIPAMVFFTDKKIPAMFLESRWGF